jgi:hypothetical protein
VINGSGVELFVIVCTPSEAENESGVTAVSGVSESGRGDGRAIVIVTKSLVVYGELAVLKGMPV